MEKIQFIKHEKTPDFYSELANALTDHALKNGFQPRISEKSSAGHLEQALRLAFVLPSNTEKSVPDQIEDRQPLLEDNEK